MLTERRAGQIPAFQTAVFQPKWKQYTFPLSAFETDGRDILALAVARVQEVGKFQFDLDQVEIR